MSKIYVSWMWLRMFECKFVLVMGRTPFYRTLNKLEHHFSNIKRTRQCSSNNDQTRTPEFWLRTNRHRTDLNIKQTQTCSSFSNRTRTPYIWLWTIEHRISNNVRHITMKHISIFLAHIVASKGVISKACIIFMSVVILRPSMFIFLLRTNNYLGRIIIVSKKLH